MQRDRLQTSVEDEQRSRRSELTMITAVGDADDAEGVWDGQSGELIAPGFSDEERERVESQLAVEDPLDDDVVSMADSQGHSLGEQRVRTDGPAVGPNGVPIQQSPKAVEVADAPRIGAGESPARKVERLDRSQQTRIVRISADLDPTIARVDWHFKKGKRYEVPIHVAMHLHEKGYVSSWG